MYKIEKLLIIVTLLVMVIAGCAPAATPAPAQPAAPAEETKSIILVMSQPKGDPFADLVYSGLQKLQTEEGDKLSIKLVESVDKAEFTDQVRTAAEDGANPVMVLWDDLAAVVVDLAPSYPDTNFIIIDSTVTADLANVKNVLIQPMDASFIAGVVAAKTTQTKKVGFVGGADIPVIENFFAGYAAGVKYADPTIEVVEEYAGTFVDPNKGLEVGTALFNAGADVIMHAANKTGLGVLQAAKATGKWGIGVDMWQGDVAEGSVLWSALKPADEATYLAAKEAISGSFTKGTWTFGLIDGAKLYDDRDFGALPADVQEIVTKVTEDIKAGTIKVPSTRQELESFSDQLQ